MVVYFNINLLALLDVQDMQRGVTRVDHFQRASIGRIVVAVESPVIHREAIAETARAAPDFDQEHRQGNLQSLAVCYRMLRLTDKYDELQPELESLKECLKEKGLTPQASPDLRNSSSGFWLSKDNCKYYAYTISDSVKPRSLGLKKLGIVR